MLLAFNLRDNVIVRACSSVISRKAHGLRNRIVVIFDHNGIVGFLKCLAVQGRIVKKICAICCLAISTVATACAAEEQSPYQSVLQLEFPEYEVHRVVDANQIQRRQSNHSFQDDILVGDFNLDGYSDFATMLMRDVTEADLENISETRKSTVKSVYLAVVCNGMESQNENSSYNCTALSKPGVGGFGWELDIIDWSRRSRLTDGGEVSDNTSCQAFLKSTPGKKLLSFREPFGHCDRFFYPVEDGGYAQCVYCTD